MGGAGSSKLLIAASRTPPWLASGWGCRGRRLSRGRRNLGRPFWLGRRRSQERRPAPVRGARFHAQSRHLRCRLLQFPELEKVRQFVRQTTDRSTVLQRRACLTRKQRAFSESMQTVRSMRCSGNCLRVLRIRNCRAARDARKHSFCPSPVSGGVCEGTIVRGEDCLLRSGRSESGIACQAVL
jgi:hypothetical protein